MDAWPRQVRSAATRAFLSVAMAVIVAACGLVGTQGFEPLPPGPPLECVGVPAITCQQADQDARNNAGPGVAPVRVRVVCTKAPCTPDAGEVQVDVGYSDGRRDSYGMSWASAEEAPVEPPTVPLELPMPPACQRVPDTPCHDAAISAFSSVVGQAVASIVVTCTVASCTDAAGGTDTTVTLVDGTKQIFSYSYLDAAPS